MATRQFSQALATAVKTVILLLLFNTCTRAQNASSNSPDVTAPSPKSMQQRISTLEAEVAELKAAVHQLQANSPTPVSQPRLLLASAAITTPAPTPAPEPLAPTVSASEATPATLQTPAQQSQSPAPSAIQPDDSKLLSFLHTTTINVALDGYYDYNFNAPVGRVNLLRAYDVLSNEFSLNQADVIFDHPADVADGRRWGGRLDLQFGQATDTLQGNPNN
jgi:hypothetical protein